MADKTLAHPKAQIWKSIWNFSSFTCFFSCVKLLADSRGFSQSVAGWAYSPYFDAAVVVGSSYLILQPGDWRCYQFVSYWLCTLCLLSMSRIGACLPDGKGCAETHP